MNKLILIIALCLLTMGAYAQQYEKSGGVRLGVTSGLTYKTFIHKEEAVEFMLSGRQQGIQLTGLYVFHYPMEVAFNENFYVYYGLGAHIGYEHYKDLRRVPISYDPAAADYENKNYFVMGGDALLGVEYRWLSVPVTVGFDVKPYFNFIDMRYARGRFWDVAISCKYVF